MNSTLPIKCCWLLAAVLSQAAPPSFGAPKTTRYDLTPLHDAQRVLVNPHKGWYHHYPDNHIDKYQIARDEDLLRFRGMDHLYLRLAWAYLEPKEGQFDWAIIDRIIAKWTAHGLGIAFRISWIHTVTKAEKSWLPGAPIILRADLPLPGRLKPGKHDLSVGLFDTSSGLERPVELALQAAARDADGFYRVAPLTMSEDASTQ
jgi:hypothetical protein